MADILQGAAAAPPAKRAKTDAAVSVASIPPSVCDHLRANCLHVAACDGVLLGAEGPFQHAPCSLLPYPFPRALFEQAIALARPFNALVERVSRDTAWLTRVVRSTVGHDPFTRGLLEIFEDVTAAGLSQPLQLSINRSDYMIDQPTPAATPRILQVELNTVSVSFPSLAAKMTELHRHVVGRLCVEPLAEGTREKLATAQPALAAATRSFTEPPPAADAADGLLPANGSVREVAKGLALAHQEYARTAPGGGAAPAVLMVVAPTEANVIDQRGIEEALWRDHHVPMVRASLASIEANATLAGTAGGAAGRKLLYNPAGEGAAAIEVSVFYYRAVY